VEDLAVAMAQVVGNEKAKGQIYNIQVRSVGHYFPAPAPRDAEVLSWMSFSKPSASLLRRASYYSFTLGTSSLAIAWFFL